VADPTGMGTEGANGWYRSPVTVDWGWTDDGAGIDTTRCTTTSSASTDGSHTLSAECYDLADNKGTATLSVQIDATPPLITCPAAGPFLLGSGSQPIGPAGVDASVSGLNETGSTLSGTIPTDAVGPKSLAFTALDLAGNSITQACPYNVIYDFGGLQYPVDPVPTLNAMKAGAAVPLKFSLGGDQGLAILASGYPKSAQIKCDLTEPVDPIEETLTAGSSGLNFDAASGQYSYVWKTEKSWAGTCRDFTLKLADGSTQHAYFRFTK